VQPISATVCGNYNTVNTSLLLWYVEVIGLLLVQKDEWLSVSLKFPFLLNWNIQSKNKDKMKEDGLINSSSTKLVPYRLSCLISSHMKHWSLFNLTESNVYFTLGSAKSNVCLAQHSLVEGGFSGSIQNN